MARKLVCSECNNKFVEAVTKYREVWETIGGYAKKAFMCDGCGYDIKKGEFCYCGILIDNKDNPIYKGKSQRPEFWFMDFVDKEQKFEWWGYRHTNGSLQAKRYFDPRDLEDADESPFCAKRTGVFLAGSREEALKIIEEKTK